MHHSCILCFGFIFTLTLTLGKHMVKKLTIKYGVPLILFNVILQLPITFSYSLLKPYKNVLQWLTKVLQQQIGFTFKIQVVKYCRVHYFSQ